MKDSTGSQFRGETWVLLNPFSLHRIFRAVSIAFKEREVQPVPSDAKHPSGCTVAHKEHGVLLLYWNKIERERKVKATEAGMIYSQYQ